jgi:hypothetical protein
VAPSRWEAAQGSQVAHRGAVGGANSGDGWRRPGVGWCRPGDRGSGMLTVEVAGQHVNVARGWADRAGCRAISRRRRQWWQFENEN